jgi:hypothetical protein
MMLRIVADINRFFRHHTERIAGGVVNRRIRLGAACAMRRHRSLEKMCNADRLQVGCSVRHRTERHAAVQAGQGRQHIFERRHFIARSRKYFHRLIQQSDVSAGMEEGLFQHSVPQLAQIQLIHRIACHQRLSAGTHVLHADAPYHLRHTCIQPFIEDVFRPLYHRHDWPQGVVQIEQNGFYNNHMRSK